MTRFSNLSQIWLIFRRAISVDSPFVASETNPSFFGDWIYTVAFSLTSLAASVTTRTSAIHESYIEMFSSRRIKRLPPAYIANRSALNTAELLRTISLGSSKRTWRRLALHPVLIGIAIDFATDGSAQS